MSQPVHAPPFEFFRILGPAFNFMLPRADLAVRLFPGTQVTSWYRDAPTNLRVGGSPFSQHRLGLAFDAVPPLGQTPAYLEFVRRLGLRATEELDHVHTQTFERGLLQRLGFFS